MQKHILTIPTAEKDSLGRLITVDHHVNLDNARHIALTFDAKTEVLIDAKFFFSSDDIKHIVEPSQLAHVNQFFRSNWK